MTDTTQLKRYLMSGGRTGSAPSWYQLLRVARYLGVAPWELNTNDPVHIQWIERTMAAMVAEHEAAKNYRHAPGPTQSDIETVLDERPASEGEIRNLQRAWSGDDD